MASDPRDAELVDVHLPEGVDVAALEALERDGLSDDPDHEPKALENPMHGARADLHSPPPTDRVDAEGSPRRGLSPERGDPVDQVPVGPI